MSSDCIFCKIVAGEIPSTRLYEDEHVLAFMDIGPIIKGHALVIPKQHIDPITDADAQDLHRVIEAVQKIAAALKAGLSADGINVHQANGTAAGQVVPHLHFHVIPRFRDDGHSWNWNSSTYGDAAEMQATADRITAALGD